MDKTCEVQLLYIRYNEAKPFDLHKAKILQDSLKGRRRKVHG